VTGTVSINPTGCTGSTSYADGAGNCDTLDGLEDFETATNHGVSVGDGSGFATKALADSDAPSTSTAGATLHYNTADQTFAAYSIPTVEMWAPWGYGGTTSDATTAPAPTAGADSNDECNCFRAPVLQAVAPIQDLAMDLETANTATNDTLEVGVYSEDGATQYFECDIFTTADGAQATSNDINCKAGTPATNTEILQPGDYWVCYGSDSTSGTFGAVVNAATHVNTRMCHFTQACSGGELPNTLTSPSCTFTDTRPPWVVFQSE
jgi:hypothetical protein